MEVPEGMKEVFPGPEETHEENTHYQLREYMVYAHQQDNSGKSLSMK